MKTPYKTILKQFEYWLKVQNYSDSTITVSLKQSSDFLIWIETKKIYKISSITKKDIDDFFLFLNTRNNKRRDGGISNNYIRSYYNSLRRFSKFLILTQNISFIIDVKLPKVQSRKEILTQNEIKNLFNETLDDVLGLRDRAMLAVYYSCGLRKKEGLSLNIDDIDTAKQRLFVINGKNYKQRFVPFNNHTTKIFKEYSDYSRPYLLKYGNDAFFLSEKGNRITGNAMIYRLKKLIYKADINKNIGLHSLRHSIATHLLQNGLDLNKIKIFLGHKSIESTQIYTHILNESI